MPLLETIPSSCALELLRHVHHTSAVGLRLELQEKVIWWASNLYLHPTDGAVAIKGRSQCRRSRQDTSISKQRGIQCTVAELLLQRSHANRARNDGTPTGRGHLWLAALPYFLQEHARVGDAGPGIRRHAVTGDRSLRRDDAASPFFAVSHRRVVVLEFWIFRFRPVILCIW